MTTICLNMIVRDASAVIERCLQSARPWIDYWVIVDTGSSDDTMALVESALRGVPGELHQAEFVDFATTRNQALELCQDKSDYVLMLDADMTLAAGDEGFKDKLDLDGYFLRTSELPRRYGLRLVRSAFSWAYFGVTRAFLVTRDASRLDRLADVSIVQYPDGPAGIEAKRERDTLLLDDALHRDPADAHALFHRARLHAAQEQWHDALAHFDRFQACDNQWDDEWSWFALYQRAFCLERLDGAEAEVAQAYLDAFQRRPARAEPLYQLGRYYRERQQLDLAEIYAGKAMGIRMPDDLFDLDTSIYKWHLPAEYALICYRLERHDATVRAANRALEERAISRNARDSLLSSRRRSLDAIYGPRVVKNEITTPNRIRVVVPFRNAKAFLAPCIESIARQHYPNFSATFIDDCSDDGSSDLVPGNDPRFELITNPERVGPLVNRVTFILSCDADDIVVYLDGDDQLASDDALSYINALYNRYDCWLTYGQFITQNGNLGWAQPHATPKDLAETLDTGSMKFPIHPLTHRAGLLHRLKDFDPGLASFKDENGNWLFYASDAVMGRPLFMMAGWDRVIYNDRVVYLYTEGHEISESIHNKSDQLEACRIANSKLKPPRLASYEQAAKAG